MCIIDSNSTDCIYQNACRLFDELWNHNAIRLLGIRTTKLTDTHPPIQLNLFDDTAETSKIKKQEQLDHAIDTIRSKYGSHSVIRGSLLHEKDSFKKH